MSVIQFRTVPSAPHGSHDDPDGIVLQNEYKSIREILTDYVQPDSKLPLDEAVDQVVKFWNDTRPGYNNAVLAEPISLTEEIPYDHPSHRKLAEFMLALHDSGKWMTESNSEGSETENRSFWNKFCGYIRESDWPPRQDTAGDEDPIEYANRCAFIANLQFAQSEPERFSYIEAHHAIAHAIDLEPTLDIKIRDARVIAAAQFIILQADTIFSEVLKTSKREAAESATQRKGNFVSRLFRPNSKRAPGPRPIPEQEFYAEDWRTWKEMFRAAAADEMHGESCREIARGAADLMALQEKTEDDRLPEGS